MKIVFIRPNIGNYRSRDAMQPLVFAILKSLTPKNIETILFDEKLEEIPLNLTADLIAITIETFTAKRAYEIAASYRKRNIRVAMGGYHATALPEEVSEYADAVVIGDAENVWEELIKDLQNHQLQKFYKSGLNNPVFTTSFDRSIFLGKRYPLFNLVQWGRGCRFNCDFCSVSSLTSGKQFLRPVNDVINEIAVLDKKTIFFTDDNLYHNKSEFRLFLEELCKLKIKWTCQITIDVTKDSELMQLMSKSGCIAVIVGFESINADCIRQMKKNPNSVMADNQKAISVFHEYGIMIFGTFIFGYDADDKSSFNQTAQFAIKNKFFIGNFNTLYAMPETPLYKRMLMEGRLPNPKWWVDPDFYYGKSMIIPKGMTENELEEGSFRAKIIFNTIPSIFQRIWKNKAALKSLKNVVLFLIINLVNRREICRKQRTKLGK